MTSAYYYEHSHFKIELSPGSWTDVTQYVVGAVEGEEGIHGCGPLDRIADPGKIKLTLRNTNNYFTPGHGSCLSGFQTGIKLKWELTIESVTYCRFYGVIYQGGIRPKQELGISYTEIEAMDYIERMANHELSVPAYTTAKRADEIIALIVANMPVAPLSTSYLEGQDVYPCVFDTSTSKTPALSEAAKVILSEMGYLYMRHSYANPEILCCEGRHSRISTDLSHVFFGGLNYDAIFENSMQSVDLSHGEHYFNCASATIYPRRTDAGTDTILYEMQDALVIAPSETVTIKSAYSDPAQQAVSVCGMDMQTPSAALGDYQFVDAEDGAEINSDLGIVATYGAAEVSYALTNNHATSATLLVLRARGRGIYVYQQVGYSAEDAALVSADGRWNLGMDLKYQTSQFVAKDFVTAMLDLYKTKRTLLTGAEWVANRSTWLLDMFAQVQVGWRIHLHLTTKGIEGDYYVQGLSWRAEPGGLVSFHLDLLDADLVDPLNTGWRLGYGQLGSTTTLSF
jgi:hypothetical protein